MKAIRDFKSSKAQLSISRYDGEFSLFAGEEQWAIKEAMEAKENHINHKKEELSKIGHVYRELKTHQLSLVSEFPCASLNLLSFLMRFLHFLKQYYIL